MSTSTPTPQAPSQPDPYAKMLVTPITTENEALTSFILYLNLAQRRGAFSFQEANKIYEGIRLFEKYNNKNAESSSSSPPPPPPSSPIEPTKPSYANILQTSTTG